MDFEQEIETLKDQVKALLVQNQALRNRAIEAEKKEANHLIDAILKVIEQGDKLESDFLNLVDKVESDELLIDLAEVNNPNSEVLGFKFTDIVLKGAHKHFLVVLPMEDRARFIDVVSNAVQSPFLKALMSINPISWLVSSVVDKVANFKESVKGKPKERILSVKKAFVQEKLDLFTKEMEEYFPFYDALLFAADTYEASVDNLGEKNKQLEKRLENYYERFLSILELDKNAHTPLLRQVQQRFTPKIVEGMPNYEAILTDEKNKEAYRIALKFPELKEKTQELIAEYQTILSDYLEDNLDALALAKGLTTDNVGLEKLENRIKERQTHLSDLTNDR